MFFKTLKRVYCLLFVTFFFTINNYGQTNIDSVLLLIKTTKNDSVKCTALNSLSLELCYRNTNAAFDYAHQATNIAERLNSFYLKQKSYLSTAICYDVKDDYNNCKVFFHRAISAAKFVKDKSNLATVYYEFGFTNLNRNKLDSSIVFLLQSIDIRKEMRDTGNLIQAYNMAAQVYRRMNNFNNAIDFYNRAIVLSQKIHDEYAVSIIYKNLGTLYRSNNKIDTALFYLTQALPLAQKFNVAEDINSIKLNTAFCYNDKHLFFQAVELFKTLDDTLYAKSDEYPLFILGKGQAYLGTKQLGDAYNYLSKALTLTYKKSRIEYAGIVNKSLAEYYEQSKNYALALQHYKKYKILYDSQYVESNTKNVDALATKYKTKEKEQEIELLNKESLLKDLQLKEKKRTILLNTLGLVLVTIVAGGTFYMYRSKKKTNKELEEKNTIISSSLKEKEILLKEIHHRVKNNLQVISSLLNLQSKNISDEKALQALNEGKNRVRSMALIHQNLYRDDNLVGVDVQQYIQKLIESLFTSYNIEIDKIALQTNIDKLQLDVDTVIPLGLILNELISNALKYAFADNHKGVLQVDLLIVNNQLLLRVKDNGRGMDKEALKSSQSMGYKLVQSFLQKLQASMNIETENGTNIELLISKYKLV